MERSERDRLADRFGEMARKEGLVDVKFLLKPSDEATAEGVCEEINALLDAVAGGSCAPLDFKDSARK